MENFNQALQLAKSLPTHIEGILQPQTIDFIRTKSLPTTIFAETITPAIVFQAWSRFNRQNTATRYYILEVPTYRQNGTMNPKQLWTKKLMFHKAYSRRDIEITNVTFDIVGVKRQTTHLPAGVLISNIQFI